MDRFWEEWQKVGQELIDYGEEILYGNSLIEVKFMAGKPAVIIRSKSIKTKYPNSEDAEMAIAKTLHDSTRQGFDGARTFTVAYRDGAITQVLLDEYANNLVHLAKRPA